MAKEEHIRSEAERLYVYEQCTMSEIASKLQCSEKTIWSWKEKGEWDRKRSQYLTSRNAFHEELYDFSRHLLKSIRADMDAGNKVDAGRLYTLTKLLPNILKVKDYEEVAAKKGDQPGDSKDVVKFIEREILGIEGPSEDPPAPDNQ